MDAWLDAGAADEMELNLYGLNEKFYRFAEGRVHQPQHREIWSVSCRGVWNGCTARREVRPEEFNEREKVFARLREQALASGQKIPFLPMIKAPVPYPSIWRWDPELESLEPADHLADALFRFFEAHGGEGTGFVALRHHLEIYGNVHGVYAEHAWTEWEASLTVEFPEGSFYFECSHWQWTPDRFRRQLEQLESFVGVRHHTLELKPGRYPTLLLPTAFADLLEFVTWGMNGLEIHEGSSFLSGKIGADVFGQNISLYDWWDHPDHDGRFFDGEGVPRQKVALVQAGRFVQPVYDRLTAREAGVEPTGHGFPVPNPWGAMVSAAVMEGSEKGVEALIASMDEGLVIPRTWYVRLVDPKTVTLTGMTRDGAFWVKNGKPFARIRDMRFNQSMVEALNRVVSVGVPVRAGEEFGKSVVPPVLVDGFRFTSHIY